MLAKSKTGQALKIFITKPDMIVMRRTHMVERDPWTLS